jgi:NAD(P)-dependent dehydrogenase (short-subunit alcohol dehydrogenase family)
VISVPFAYIWRVKPLLSSSVSWAELVIPPLTVVFFHTPTKRLGGTGRDGWDVAVGAALEPPTASPIVAHGSRARAARKISERMCPLLARLESKMIRVMKRVFITGGASGFGKALAQRFAREGSKVCIGDIHDERGRETARDLGNDAHYVRCDVTKDDDLTAVADWLGEQWGGVDLVVNNAGVAVGGGIVETPMSDWHWICDINLLGVVRGCRTFTPMFRKQGKGHFLNVASMAGLIHPPLMSAYNATKAAVVALSETLRSELRADGIGVSVVCPSFFKTNLTESLRSTDRGIETAMQGLVGRSRYSAESIADLTYRGLSRGDFLILTHADGKVAWMLKRFTPFAVYSAAMSETSKRLRRRYASS